MISMNRLLCMTRGRQLLTKYVGRRNVGGQCMSSKSSNISNTNDVVLHWLDLQGCGLSALERLCLEEALLRHDPMERSWAIVGCHDPTYSSRLTIQPHLQPMNNDCIIIMGIGGKVDQLLNVQRVRDDGAMVLKRFSGGGTVIVDHSSLWTTFIGRHHHHPNVSPYPRDIMEWSAKTVFGPTFQRMNHAIQESQNEQKSKTLIVTGKSCGVNDGKVLYQRLPSGDDGLIVLPKFELRENDYVLGTRKMGGNAQSIVKNGWLHHTSFLWDYDDDNMKDYLTLPPKRPEYRANRSHDDFLMKLKTIYGNQHSPKLFFQHVHASTEQSYPTVQPVSLQQVMKEIFNENSPIGTFQNWFETKCRTRIIQM